MSEEIHVHIHKDGDSNKDKGSKPKADKKAAAVKSTKIKLKEHSKEMFTGGKEFFKHLFPVIFFLFRLLGFAFLKYSKNQSKKLNNEPKNKEGLQLKW